MGAMTCRGVELRSGVESHVQNYTYETRKIEKFTTVYTLTQQTSQNIYFKKFPHSFLRFPTFCNFSIAVPRNSSTRDLPRLLTTWGPVSTELCLGVNGDS